MKTLIDGYTKSAMQVAVLLILFSRFGLAQDADANAVSSAMKAASNGQPLRAISLLESVENNGAYRDILGMLYASVSDWEKAMELRPEAAKKYVVTPPEGYRVAPALDEIIRASKGHRIVIINEAHDSPRHRAFIGRLAELLARDGFQYYAAETLSEDGATLSRRGYPVSSSGFYTSEPRFGDLVRDVLGSGLKPIAYEAKEIEPTGNPIDDINARESEQCRNLIDKVFSTDAKARILVHVGLDHVMEEPRTVGDAQIQWLANRLKEATGINPLTIDQISSLRMKKPHGDEPIVVYDSNDQRIVAGPYRGFVDMQVFHPLTVGKMGRPDWLLADKRRQVVEIPSEIASRSSRLLVQAFDGDESDDAVPVDQVLLSPKGQRPVLCLRPGTYRIVAQDDKGTQVFHQSLDTRQ